MLAGSLQAAVGVASCHASLAAAVVGLRSLVHITGHGLYGIVEHVTLATAAGLRCCIVPLFRFSAAADGVMLLMQVAPHMVGASMLRHDHVSTRDMDCWLSHFSLLCGVLRHLQPGRLCHCMLLQHDQGFEGVRLLCTPLK